MTKKVYGEKFDDPAEMSKHTEGYKPLRQIHEETENQELEVNSPEEKPRTDALR